MSDSDQTVLSTQGASDLPGAPQQPTDSKRKPLLIIGGIGCVLLLCAGLVIGAGFLVGGGRFNNLVANITGEEDATETPVPPTPAPSSTSTPTSEPTEEVDTSSVDSATEEAVSEDPTPTESAEREADPEIGRITFALDATDDYEPIEAGILFEGEVTEIHAIFEYTDLSSDLTWERVWYLDDVEMLRSDEAWSGAENGVFDYFINAGGEPLAAGEWVLELYVEGDLLASGGFVIINDEPTEVAQESGSDSEHAADLDPTPTSLPSPTATAAPAPTAVPAVARTFKLAYTKWDGGRHNIYISNTNGAAEQFVLHNGAGPSWSQGGGSLIFFGEPGVNRQNRDAFPSVGGCELPGVSDGIVAVSVPPAPQEVCQAQSSIYQGPGWNDGTARWASVSPDDKMVAYDARPGGDYRIYFLGTSDNQQYQFEILGEQASWSPDSQKIVYRSGRDGKTGIWISNRNDSGHTLITNGNDSFPTWSLDGRTIAFARDEGGNVDIYTVNVDGSNMKRLTEAPGPDTLPVFTPSGEIIFRSARSGSWGIWKMSGSGSNQKEIISDAGVGPDWAGSKMSVLP